MKTQNALLVLAILITSLLFGQNNALNTTGNVGIGTTTPESSLHLKGPFSLTDSKGILAIESPDVYSSLYFGIGKEAPYIPFFQSATRQNNNPYDLLINPRGGNVGIGTTTPNSKLDVYIATPTIGRYDSQKWSTNNSNYNLKLQTIWNDGGINQEFVQRFNGTDYTSLAFYQGNIGIGTTTPTAKLEVNGNLLLTNDGNSIQFKNDAVQISRVIYQDAMKFDSYGGFQFYDSSSGSERLRILSGGNVGIGTNNPDEKLTVKGKIHAEEIIVDLSVPADYVFQKYYTGKSNLKSDYIMPTLAEIESFTKKNHHLPNVPSAQEVQQNGVSLGTMSNVLLQKVEELTLYAIEQQNKLDEQNKTIATLAARLASLEKK